MKEQREYGVAQRQEAQAFADAEKMNLKVWGVEQDSR